jgi:D-psicose/D-tagatose/L-ribulose 3-epimerase
MEPFVTPGGEVGSDIKVYRNLSADKDMDIEVRNACQFIRRKMQAYE